MNVIAKKEIYNNNSVLVYFYEQGATKKEKRMKPQHILIELARTLERPPAMEEAYENVDVVYDKIIECASYTWEHAESEVDEAIEIKLQELQNA
jgi:hypothetical protein